MDTYLHLRLPGGMMSSNMKASHIIAVLNICKRGDAVFLGKLLASNCNFDEVKDRKGRNALHYCAETDEPGSSSQAKPGGRLTCASLLLNSEFKLQDQADNEGFLPFHHAVIHGNIPLVKILLTHGGDVNALVNPLHSDEVYQEEGNTAVAGRSALHLAVIYANYEMLDFLLSGSFEDDKDITHEFSIDVNIQDSQSATALHYAVQLPESIAASVIKCIIEKSDADINCADAHGRTPLIWAATIGASLPTSILLELGADLSKAEKSWLTALHCSASRGHVSTVQAIIDYLDKSGMKEEQRKEILNAQDTDGCSPLFYSITLGHLGATKKLLAAGADPNATDSRGRSLFHCVSRAPADSVLPIIDLLLDYEADPCKVNAIADTPLHEACSNSNKECVERLLQVPIVVDNLVNLKNAANQTPLQISTQQALKEHESNSDSSDVIICQLLINAGAKVGTEEETETSPLSMVRNCLRNTPSYRPALELERVFSSSKADQKDSTNVPGAPIRRESTTTTSDVQEISELSAVSFGRSTHVEENTCNTYQEEKIELSSSSSIKSDRYESRENDSAEIRKFVNEQIDVAASLENVAKDMDENTSEHSCVPVSQSKNTPSVRSHSRSNSKDASSVAISRTSRVNSIASNESLVQGAKSLSLSTSIPRKNQSSRRSTLTYRGSAIKSLEADETNLPRIPSRRSSSSSKCFETAPITKEQSRRGTPSIPSTPILRKTPTPKSNSTVTSEKICNEEPSKRSTLTSALQTRKFSSRQTEENTVRGPSSVTTSIRSTPLKAQHLPAWTQTSLEVPLPPNNKHPRPSRSSDRINELAKPRRRPRSSCDFPRKSSEFEGRQKLPQPTITPYLMPVAKWPRSMASMLLMGEVSPLYCAQTLNAMGPMKPKKRPKKVPTERVRSAMEARVQLSLAEKDFVKLAAQVLDQYDTLLIERQKLARNRTTQQVGEKY
ncbi:hypothetical protein Aperf_G00000084435 [Anoplocephala perfoliata]